MSVVSCLKVPQSRVLFPGIKSIDPEFIYKGFSVKITSHKVPFMEQRWFRAHISGITLQSNHRVEKCPFYTMWNYITEDPNSIRYVAENTLEFDTDYYGCHHMNLTGVIGCSLLFIEDLIHT